MKNHRVLITGGCGFIGANLIRYLLRQTDWDITILDNLSTGKRQHIDGLDDSRIIFIKGDIRRNDDVKKAIKDCDYVVNLAAHTGVILSIEDPFLNMDVNVKGMLTILKKAVENDILKFVQASSGAPLGNQEMPLNENKVPAPLSPYGASKLAAEGYCSAFADSFNLITTVLRFSNVYGPWSSSKESVVALFIRQILDGTRLTIYGDGNQTRDFIHANDISQAIYLSLIKNLPNKYELFQIATGVETSINNLYQMISQDIEKYGYSTIEPKHNEPRAGEIYRNYSDIDKAKKILDYKPSILLNQGIKDTIEWFIKQNSIRQ